LRYNETTKHAEATKKLYAWNFELKIEIVLKK